MNAQNRHFVNPELLEMAREHLAETEELVAERERERARADRTQTEWFKWLTVPGRTFAIDGETYAVIPGDDLEDLRDAETVVEAARNLLRHGPIDGPDRWLAKLETAVRTYDGDPPANDMGSGGVW